MDNLVICERQDLVNIADAIREKIESSDGLTLDGMVDAIGELKAGGGANIVTGTITPTSESANIVLENVFPAQTQAPRAYWIYEVGKSYADTTHTKKRIVNMFMSRMDGCVGTDTTGSYYGSYRISSAGSNYASSGHASVTSVFSTRNNETSSINLDYDLLYGDYKKGSLWFGCNSTTRGLIAGRTYEWGVVLWDE